MRLVIEVQRDEETGLLVGWIEGRSGVHAQGPTLPELLRELGEVLEMLDASSESEPPSP